MSTSGVKIGMVVTVAHRRATLPDQVAALSACCAGVVGATTRGTVAFRFVASSRRRIGTAAAASAWFFSPSLCLGESGVRNLS